MMWEKITLSEYTSKESEKINIDDSIIRSRQSKGIHRQLLDIWGEVDSCLSLYDSVKKKKASTADLLSQLESVHNCCYSIYTDPNATKGLKWELKVAEWELYDFILWDNEFKNSRKSVTLWFDEWCFQTNFEVAV